MNAQDFYRYDERDVCPLCNRSHYNCLCGDEEIEDFYDEQDAYREDGECP